MAVARFSAGVALIGLALAAAPAGAAWPEDDVLLAIDLARMLAAAREVISDQQALINDPTVGHKGLSGKGVLRASLELYLASSGRPPAELKADARAGAVFDALTRAIVRAVDDQQPFLNRSGVGFKGYVPTVFSREVSRHFERTTEGRFRLKITGPARLVRTRNAKPDAWEKKAIERVLSSPVWPHGKTFSTVGEIDGRAVVRVLVLEYYSQSCLACHGDPAGQRDVTGYEKEGGKLGEIGGVISVIVFR